MTECMFCDIATGKLAAHIVLDEEEVVGFLDARPVFKGHVLVVPRRHYVTLGDLPASLIEPYFGAVQNVSASLPTALGAQGSFVGLNNVVSQSVPHLHTHVVPRTKGDGLRGFFWPRLRYDSDEEAAEYAARILAAIKPTAKWLADDAELPCLAWLNGGPSRCSTLASRRPWRGRTPTEVRSSRQPSPMVLSTGTGSSTGAESFLRSASQMRPGGKRSERHRPCKQRSTRCQIPRMACSSTVAGEAEPARDSRKGPGPRSEAAHLSCPSLLSSGLST
jgi:histidine triad (HIT) family protein